MTEPDYRITRTMDPPAYTAIAFAIDARDKTEYCLSTADDVNDTARRLLLRWIYADPGTQDLMLSRKKKVTT